MARNSRHWSGWYSHRRWRRLRKAQLQREPLCRHCLDVGIITPANEVDHIEPHRGNRQKFWSGPFQSLCKRCHWNKTYKERWFGANHPDIEPPACRLVVVCGPPASGKTTYCKERMRQGDILIDWDDFLEQISGVRHSWTRPQADEATKRRNDVLASLKDADPAVTAWVPTMAATEAHELYWRGLGAEMVRLDVSRRECERRIRSDPVRRQNMEMQNAALDAYFGKREIAADGAPSDWL